MKILKSTEFLALSSGVLFCTGGRWHFGGLEVKGETVVVDGRPCGYWSVDLQWIDGDGSTGDDRDDFVRLEKMLAEGVSFPINKGQAKTMPVDHDALFLVLEAGDLDFLIGMATRAKREMAKHDRVGSD